MGTKLEKRRVRARKRRIKVIGIASVIAIILVSGSLGAAKVISNKNSSEGIKVENDKQLLSNKEDNTDKLNDKEESKNDGNKDKDNIKDKDEKDKENKDDIKENIVVKSLKDDPDAMDAKLVQDKLKTWNYQREDNRKIAYLTFDDGPSTTVTPKILDVLEANNIKGTFFVIGSAVDKSEDNKEILKDIAKEGHAIANHGYSHDYKILYPNRVVDVKAFMNDMKRGEEALKSVLGEDFHTRVIRFPGGHNSWKSNGIDSVLEEEGYVYIDWNTLSGDAEGRDKKSSNQLVNRLKETVNELETNNDEIVVLMHDTYGKEATAESLQGIIDYLKGLGYEFKTLK